MKLADLGEFGFIRRFAGPFQTHLPSGVTGIGDDCAIIPWTADTCQLVTTDMLVEDVHFLRQRTPPQALGEKSLAVNLSDIAAMGGKPTHAFLSIGIPAAVEVEWLDAFFTGLRTLAEHEQVSLLGGDTTSSPGPLIVNIAVLGLIPSKQIKRRSAARPGDSVCVTGELGDAGGGLRVLLDALTMGEDERYLLDRQHRPQAHVQEGQWLGEQPAVHAMLDISDGIDADIRHIMEQSACGAIIDLARLPRSPALLNAAQRHQWDCEQLAATSGEDYCLLLTVAPDQLRAVQAAFQARFARPLTTIGTITDQAMQLLYTRNDQPVQLQQHGFEHFADA